MSLELKLVNAGNKSDETPAIENKNEDNVIVVSDTVWFTKEHLEQEQQNQDNIMYKKFDKEKLLERFSKTIDKANDFLDKEDVRKVKQLFFKSNGDEKALRAAASEAFKLEQKYCTFDDRAGKTALMMAITGDILI